MDMGLIPTGVAELCGALREAGWEAYPVGGCVRDLLLGREPGDWDVATSAPPEAVMALFPKTVPTGLKHGTVTVPTADGGVEATTFRREGGYADGRHPDAVDFRATLEEDLSRRDFTVNAMALGPDGAVIDPFGGQADLHARLLRCVGEAERRFREDALRMLRALRFAAQLGFAVEEGTAAALRRNAGLAGRLSAERVRTELEKTLLAPWPERGEGLFAWGLLAPWLDCPAEPDLTTLHRVAEKPLERWAALCALLDEAGAVRDGEAFLRRLRLDGKTASACGAGLGLLRRGLPGEGALWRRALAEVGEPGCRAAAAMGDALTGGAYSAELEEILAARPCVRVEDLALKGRDLAEMGYAGREIGLAQARLLGHVLDCPEDNTRRRLERLLRAWREEEACPAVGGEGAGTSVSE